MSTENIFKIAAGIVTLLVIAFIVFSVNSAPSEATVPALLAVKNTDLVKGPAEAPLTLVEYADFQCPACATYHPLVKKMSEEFASDLKIVFRHFPLSQHPNAVPAAKAAEAAGAQGKFWEMHDKLFEAQTIWANEPSAFELFKGYAKELGLDETKFTTDYNDGAFEGKIKDQQAAGNALGVNATPTFYLNGKKVSGITSEASFRQIISNALAEISNRTAK